MAVVKVVQVTRGFYKGTPVTMYGLLFAKHGLLMGEARSLAEEKRREYEAQGYECRPDALGYTCIKGTDVVVITAVADGPEDLEWLAGHSGTRSG